VLGANFEVLAEYLSLVNSGAELEFLCVVCQELQYLHNFMVLLYIEALLGRTGGWRPESYPL
jgi:hypothetical protein